MTIANAISPLQIGSTVHKHASTPRILNYNWSPTTLNHTPLNHIYTLNMKHKIYIGSVISPYVVTISALTACQMIKVYIPEEHVSGLNLQVKSPPSHLNMEWMRLISGIREKILITPNVQNNTKRNTPNTHIRPVKSPVVLLCFYSGKIVITGGKAESDVRTPPFPNEIHKLNIETPQVQVNPNSDW